MNGRIWRGRCFENGSNGPNLPIKSSPPARFYHKAIKPQNLIHVVGARLCLRLIPGNAGGWAITEDNEKPAGNYATREGALEGIYLAASNDIKKDLGVTLGLSLRRPMNPPQAVARTQNEKTRASGCWGKFSSQELEQIVS